MTPGAMRRHAGLCGQTLARAHARAGDAAAIAGYIGSGDALPRALAVFAEAYADQNQRDHEALRSGDGTGRLADLPPDTPRPEARRPEYATAVRPARAPAPVRPGPVRPRC